MTKSIKTILVVSLFFSIGGTIGYVNKSKILSVGKKIYRHLFGTSEKTSQKKIPICSFTKGVLPKINKDDYILHQNAGQRLSDMVWIENDTIRKELIQKNILVELSNQKGYNVRHMNHGFPYVHKDMLLLIQEMEQEFLQKTAEQKLSDSKFIITSASRTEVQQAQLRPNNKNASRGKSSHSYGASVDIAFVQGEDCEQAKTILANILIDFQAKKKLLLTPESETIHVTINPK